MRIFLLGLAGSGKGTVSKLLLDLLNDSSLKYYNVGEILRSRSEEDNHIKQIHAAGGLVNSDRVLDIFENALQQDSFIVDGSPRKQAEAEFVLNHPNWKSNPGYLIHLEVDIDIARKRLETRKRFDDSPDIMSRRFEGFKQDTMKSINAFQDAGRLFTVDASQSPKEVCYDILKFIQSRVK
jgi:adenylate kinase family enzyme